MTLTKAVRDFLIAVLLVAICFLAFVSQFGCQVGFSVDAQTFYPDEAGKGNNIGDPRKGRYQFGNTSATERVQSVESKFNTLPERGGK